MSQDNLLYKMSTTQKYDIPIAHLDYEYIEGCQDVKYLEKILRVLRSGDEGRYPEMEDRCEKRIDLLDPNSRVLRKETPMKKVGELDREEGKSIQNDIMEWSTGMKEAEIGLNGSSEFDDDSLPPVRSGSTCISLSGEVKKASEEDQKKKAAMPRSYKEWDKFDVDKELETVEKETPKENTKSAAQPVIENIIDSTGMSEREKEMKANREKDKGNEAFKAGDYQEAISYYSRSISLQPTAASYNNRALAYLKTKEWLKAETDCNKVLTLEPKNIKALLRRGTARKGKKCFTDAQADFEEVLELEPNNKRAKELIDELKKEEEKAEKETKERKEKGRRMVIEEVEGEDEESADEEIIVDKKEDGKFENKKQSVSLKSEELNKNKIVNGTNQHQNSLVNGFHESSNKTEENKEIWSEEEISGSGFKTVRTKSANDSNDNTSVENSEKVLKNRQGNTQDSHSQVPAEVENSENENKVNASAENEITIVGKSESEVKHECVNSDSKDKPTESSNKTQDVILSRPVLIQGELPGPAGKLREKGNQLFKEGQYAEAVKRYSEAIQKLQKGKLDHTVNLSLLYSNRAACHLKTGDCPAAIKDCNMSLELVPHAIKPLLRRGNAYEVLERYRMAYVDYKHVLNVDRTVDMAHQGSTRCQSHLQETDGPKWREKLPPIPSVSPWEIPDIRTEKESTKISSTVSTSLPQASTSSETRSSISSSSSSESKTSQASDSKSSTVLSDASLSSSEPKKSKQESFDTIKARGNEFVKQSDFKKAIECYTMCIEKSPDQAVSYTNRALCYLRTNQAEQAEQDCTQALTYEPDNVKALFRRAQAKKMLKKFKESLSDLVHLLRVDPKNTAAQREIELVKDYWRAELRSRPTPSSSSSDDDEEESKTSTQNTTPAKKTPQTTQPKVSPNEKPSTKSNTQPKVSPNEKPSTKSNTKQEPPKGKQKSRKRMVIQEVESDASEGNNTSAGTKSTENRLQGQTAAEKKITPNSSQEQTAKKEKPSKPTAAGQQELTEKKTKPDKTSQKHSSEKKDNAKSSQKSSKSSTATSAKQASRGSQQAGQNASAGLPVVPPSVPKLEKATPYEFIQAWNSLKKAEDIQPYADLLRQIQPQDLPQVISNKLDGPMLNTITKCVAEKFVSQGEYDLSYSILKNLTNVPRFGTIAMFLSASDKKDIQVVLQKLQKNPSSVYGSNNIVTLKKEFGIKL